MFYCLNSLLIETRAVKTKLLYEICRSDSKSHRLISLLKRGNFLRTGKGNETTWKITKVRRLNSLL